MEVRNAKAEIIIALISASVGILTTLMANYEKIFPPNGNKIESVSNIDKTIDSLKIHYADSIENHYIKYHNNMLDYSDISLLYRNFMYAFSQDQIKDRSFDFYIFTSAAAGIEEIFDTNLPEGTYSIAVDTFESDIELFVDFINSDTIFFTKKIRKNNTLNVKVSEPIESIRVKLNSKYKNQQQFYSLLIFSNLE